MQKLTFEISVSLDGFIAGPNPSLQNPLGEGGERLHEWGVQLAAWAGSSRAGRRRDERRLRAHGESQARARARAGAVVMGRKMFSGGEGPWKQVVK